MAQRTALESRWTPHEDELLTAAVRNFGEHDNWKTVAQAVPGRTNKACRKRWLHSLSPAVKKSAWTPSEDRLLIELYTANGPKWSAIARQIHGRTDDACSKRYREALDPNLKKDEWTPEEDAQLMQAYARIGGKWGQVGQELRRSGLGCRNRWRMLERNRVKALKAPAPTPHVIFDESHFLHAGLPPTDLEHLAQIWPVYYPPEAYPSVLGTEELSQGSHSFREPTPQMPDSPEVPPFNFASSSLSAALSDPPRTSLPLPPVPDEEPLDNNQQEPEPVASTSHSPPQHYDSVPYEFNTISPAQLSLYPSAKSQFETFAKRVSDFPSPPASSSSSSPRWRSPRITSSTDSLPLLDGLRPPGRTFDHIPSDTSVGLDTSSSSSSSPFVPPSSLSPADSPIPYSPVELPAIEHLPVDSLLFSASASPSQHYRIAPSKRDKRVRKPSKAVGETRLSASLPLSTTDPNIRAYACGRYPCWPADAQIGHACFATSKDLIEHRRLVHGEGGESPDDRPYRCALAGCGKSWKTLNGLQYHLQISTAHFRNALSCTFKSVVAPDDGDTATAPSQDPEDAEPESRGYICHHPHCFKAYKQPSGLRYHLKHGHPPAAQLEMVPPTLAREIPKKTRKMRRKESTEDLLVQRDSMEEGV
ncbi:Transcriptional activator Myb [Mycena venus]|uniref:Transcriptional activator Myb n=1 Tax=Mycena venus TaxID=2733690 RepID=A0A8H7CJP4_9AGAR|nr:Transcriptional activator Myb [Mycena venus]